MDTPAVVLDSDALRLNHPLLPQIMASDPQRMDVLSNGPVGGWMSGLIDHARHRGYNTVVENTLTNPEQVAATARAFSDAGYTVSIAALAVPEQVSRLGIVTRYLAGVDHDEFPRWTTENSHSRSYTGMLTGLESVTNVVDQIDVFDRQGDLLYRSSPLRGG